MTHTRGPRFPARVGAVLVAALASSAFGATTEQSLTRLDGSTVPLSVIEQRIPELMAKVWLPGMSVAVVSNGAIAYRRSFGVRDAGTGVAISPVTSFTGLSFSKTITAYLVMRLAERGVLDIDRPLHGYLSKPLPEYERYADLAADPRYRRITARHVLSHTTGWPNWRFFTESGKLQFLFDPGARHSYSGEGFAYLQMVLEELTGMDFAKLAREEVFNPLDMARSSMIWEESFEPDYAEDHDIFGQPIGRQRRDTASAAGSLQTTIGDYTRFLIAVMNGQGLEPETRDLMLSPQVALRHARMFGPRLYEEVSDQEATQLSWTLGWGRVVTPFGAAFFHTGNDRGSANYAIAFPDARAAVVIMGNSSRIEGIAQDVVELLTGDSSSPFDFLGYARWDAPWQTWLRILGEDGFAAGRAYWESLSELDPEHDLAPEWAFSDGAEALASFGSPDDLVAFQRWRRAVFPDSADAVRGLVRALLHNDRVEEAVAELDRARRTSAPELAGKLDWFARWVGALSRPATIPVEQLRPLAGEYQARRFVLRDGRLFYGRDEARPEDYRELFAMGDDTFVLEDVDFFRLRFDRDDRGRGTSVHGLYEDGTADSNERTGEAP